MRDVDETAETRKLRTETGTLSRRDMSWSDIQFIGRNEALSGCGSCAADGREGRSTTAPPPETDAIWLCPAVVSLGVAEIAAALYAFSDVAHDVTNDDPKAVRDDLRYIVARYGTALIESVAEWLVISGPAPIPWLLARDRPRPRSFPLDALCPTSRAHTAACDQGGRARRRRS